MEIKTTTDYTKFKLINENRDINTSHINRIKQSMEIRTLTSPIIVNKNHEIIDGQHRFTALKQLNKPIDYIIVPEATRNDIQAYNLNQSNWGLADYHKYYFTKQYPEYVKLQEFMNEYNLTLNIGRLMTTKKQESRKNIINFKNGEYRFKSTRAISTAKRYNEIKYVIPTISPQRSFVVAFMNALANEKCQWAKLKTAIQKYPHKIVRCTTVGEYLKELQKIYNYHKPDSSKIRLYEEKL